MTYMTKIITAVFAKILGQTANQEKNGCNVFAPVASFAVLQEKAPVNAAAGHILTALTPRQTFFVNTVTSLREQFLQHVYYRTFCDFL